MKEVQFIRRNIEKWRSYEGVAEAARTLPADVVADAYIDLTSDLSFAQTHYPQSRITLYLNNLASALHNEIYRNKRERWSRLVTMWTQEVPLTMWQSRRFLAWSALVFAVSVVVGIVSQWLDADFCRLILGNSYVEMTLDNIARGEPMGVYGSQPADAMFAGITMNNVYVSFLVFAAGLLTPLGTGWLLMQNGIMLGSFQTFFLQQGLLGESMLAVWLHGTLEISAIIVAGAAGMALGSGLLFPGTYSRVYALRRGARQGLKIVVGTVPIFCVAGFIESFMTRHTEWPDALRLMVIGLSLAFVIGYYIVLPYKRHHGIRET